MKFGTALFSFRGRMGRRDYWLKGFPIILLAGISNLALIAVGTDSAPFAKLSQSYAMYSMLLGITSIWISLALIVKRLHDRDRTGWLAASIFIPIINIASVLWILTEVWFLKGTNGDNRYGDDSLQQN